jgi:anti-sigma B factor antagonist
MSDISELPGRALTLRSTNREGTRFVQCGGVLNSSNSALLKTEVKGCLPGIKHIVLDLTELSQMDSSGLGTIVGLYISAKNAGCRLEMINLSARIRELFSLTNLLLLFEPCGRAGTRIP